MWQEFYRKFGNNHRGLIAITGLAMFFSNLLTIVLTLLIGKFFNLLFGYQTIKGNLLDFFPFSLAIDLTRFYLLYATVLLCKLVLFYFARYYGEKSGNLLVNEVKKEAFLWQLAIPLIQYRSSGASKFMQRFSGDMNHIKKHFVYGILSPIADLAILVLFFVIIFNTHLILGIGMLALTLVSTYLLQSLDTRLNIYTKIQGSKSSKLFSHISATLNHLETIHVINRRRIQQRTFHKLNDAYTQASMRQSKQEAIYRTTIPVITYGLILFAILVAGQYQQTLGSTGLITTILLILYITPVLRRLLASGIIREKGEVAWTNLAKIKNLAVEETGKDLKTTKVHLKIKTSGEWQELNPGLHIVPHAYPHHYMDNWLQLRPLVKEKITLNGKSIGTYKASQWSKLVSPVDERYGLIGKNLHELICPQLRVFPEQMLQKFNAILPPGKQLSIQMETGENGRLLSPMQKKMAAIMRACCSSSPIIICRNLMEHIPPKKQVLVMDLLKELETDHVIILLRSQADPNQKIDTDDLTDEQAAVVSLIP